MKIPPYVRLMALVLALQVEILLLGVGVWYGSEVLDEVYPRQWSWSTLGWVVWLLICGLQSYMLFHGFMRKKDEESPTNKDTHTVT